LVGLGVVKVVGPKAIIGFKRVESSATIERETGSFIVDELEVVGLEVRAEPVIVESEAARVEVEDEAVRFEVESEAVRVEVEDGAI